MPNPSRASQLLALAATVGTVLAIAVAPPASAGAAVPRAGGDAPESVATLKIETPNVSVKKKGADDFKTAKDGQKLHAGDTIQTDGTGKAEINYGDDSWTRLEVDTTFTIEKLSDEQGDRQVEGSLDSGKAWHRTAALTESETFEQTGAGATASAVGTAFGMDCDAQGHCTTYGVVDTVEWSGNNGVHLIAPLDVCDSTNAIICADITHITADQLPLWIIGDLLKDVLRGYPWPFPSTPISGTVIVEDGNVFFIPSPPPNETTPLPPAPTVPSSAPINIVSPPPTGPAPRIETDEDTSVVFTINVTSSGGQTVIQFTDLPDPTVGRLHLGSVPGATTCSPCVNQGQTYAADSTFTFVPVHDGNSADETTSFTFVASNEGGSSAPTTVPVDVSDNDSLSTGSTSTEPESTPEPGG